MKTRAPKQTLHVLALALAIAALAVPTAHAYIPADAPAAVDVGIDQPANPDYPPCAVGPCSSPQDASPTASRPDGFDWTDAGIGAGFAIGLILLAGGVATVTLRRRKSTIPAV